MRQRFIARAVECIVKLSRQRMNTDLNVDNVLCRQPRHRCGTDVVDAKREVPKHIPQSLTEARKLARPITLVWNDRYHWHLIAPP